MIENATGPFQAMFATVRQRVVAGIRELNAVPRHIDQVFPDMDQLEEITKDTAARPMIEAYVHAAMQEIELFRRLHARKETTATQALEMLGLNDLGEWFAFEVPEWLRAEAFGELERAFSQEYWHRIHQTTRDDIQRTLERSIAEGHSIRQTTRLINAAHGAEYSLRRAKLVARTEIPNALNAGHAAGISRLNAENPELEIGKEWISLFTRNSRALHMGLDGQVVPADGKFILDGVRCNHPGDPVLPAKDRCNCLCSVLSSFVTEGLGISGNTTDVPEPEPAAPVLTDLFDILDQDPELNTLLQAALASPDIATVRKAHKKARKKRIPAVLEKSRAGKKHGFDSPQFAKANEELEAVLEEIEKTKLALEQAEGGGPPDWTRAVPIKAEDRGEIKVSFKKPGGDRKLRVPSKAYKDKAKAAADWIETVLSKRAMKSPTLKIDAHQMTASRAYAIPSRRQVFLHENSPTKTFVHEIAHVIEGKNPALLAKVREFRKRRIKAAGTSDVKLKDVVHGGYRADEIGNEDSFQAAFGSQSKYYVGKEYGGRETEILSMGLEKLFEDPGEFARKDPEFFKFIVGALRGKFT